MHACIFNLEYVLRAPAGYCYILMFHIFLQLPHRTQTHWPPLFGGVCTVLPVLASGSFMLYVRHWYEHGWSLRSVLCVHFVCISVHLLEAYGCGQNVAVPLEIVGAVSGGVTTVQARTVKHNDEQYFGKMAELFEERLCELIWNLRHIYDVTSPDTETYNSNRTAGKEEIRQEMNISQMPRKEKWRSVRHRFVRWEAPSNGCSLLHNIHPNIRYAWRYKDTDSYVI